MIKKQKRIILVGLISLSTICNSQCVVPIPARCETADPTAHDVYLDSPINVDMIFDSFGEYKGGMTLYGSTIIKIKVKDVIFPILPVPPGPCQWKLVMYVSNGVFALPATDWDQQAEYGSAGAGSLPQLDLLEVKVSNGCGTPLNNGLWQTFNLATASIDIINNALLVAGCAPQVNAAGSYSDSNGYSAYSFILDYRIPANALMTTTYQPGRYQMRINFCLTEM